MNINEHQEWANSTIGDAYPYVSQGLTEAVNELLDVIGANAPMEIVSRIREELAKQQVVMAVLYCGLGLAGEAGEVTNKMKKILRDDNGELRPERIQMLKKELGGAFWYLCQSCTALGLKLNDVAATNRQEIESRMHRGTLKGDGDDR